MPSGPCRVVLAGDRGRSDGWGRCVVALGVDHVVGGSGEVLEPQVWGGRGEGDGAGVRGALVPGVVQEGRLRGRGVGGPRSGVPVAGWSDCGDRRLCGRCVRGDVAAVGLAALGCERSPGAGDLVVAGVVRGEGSAATGAGVEYPAWLERVVERSVLLRGADEVPLDVDDVVRRSTEVLDGDVENVAVGSARVIEPVFVVPWFLVKLMNVAPGSGPSPGHARKNPSPPGATAQLLDRSTRTM
ncbi:MAG: hypothetical protein JWM47_3099 [Acidimicrobiales bacterium]|nr:hypothetical protein [Acidimicrobiales bacterium]